MIAIGSNASLEAAAILIEYGYIYEPQFTHPSTRQPLIKELAFQTYLGVKQYFESAARVLVFPTSLLPYTWQDSLERGMRGREVLALQAALVEEGSFHCSLTGYFGDCTRDALIEFQEKYLLPKSGFADAPTVSKLNELYGI